MSEALSQALGVPGLHWMLLAIGVAGLVRGFCGFGTALILVPVAGVFLEPKEVIAILALTGMASSAVILPGAWRRGDRREVAIVALAAIVAVPAGLWVLELLDRTLVRWLVALIAGGTLAALIGGWRYSGRVTLATLAAIGAAAGLAGGVTGLTGPVVILFYLAGRAAVDSVRSNTIMFLAALDVALVANLALDGTVSAAVLALAVLLSIPYTATTAIGQALFNPAHERLYRRAAYAAIAGAVGVGLPVWGA